LSIIQDPVEPKLVFLGTENVLWVSVDDTKTWTKWTSGYPAGVPTIDMVIHPREHDLIIATFGRAMYVLDDIRPLRELAKKSSSILSKTVHLFAPPDAYQAVTQQPTGPRFDADAVFNGENRPSGALLTYVFNKPDVKKDTPAAVDPKSTKTGEKSVSKPVEKKDESKPKLKYDTLVWEIFSSANEKIRTIKQPSPEDNGVSRMTWSMTAKGVQRPSREKLKPTASEPNGLQVLPGVYKVRLTAGDQKDSTMITVKSDPRFNVSQSILESRHTMLKELERFESMLSESTTRLRESLDLATELEAKMKESKRTDLKDQLDKTKAIKDSLNNLFDVILDKEDKRQGLIRDSGGPVTDLQNATQYIEGNILPVNETDRRVFERARTNAMKAVDKVNAFFGKTWKDYQSTMEKTVLNPFKEYKPIR
jgi:hypothetical protein